MSNALIPFLLCIKYNAIIIINMIGKFLTFLLLLTFCLGSYDQGVARDLAYYSHFTYSLTSLSNWKCDYCN